MTKDAGKKESVRSVRFSAKKRVWGADIAAKGQVRNGGRGGGRVHKRRREAAQGNRFMIK